jgi:hypothetical protein
LHKKIAPILIYVFNFIKPTEINKLLRLRKFN